MAETSLMFGRGSYFEYYSACGLINMKLFYPVGMSEASSPEWHCKSRKISLSNALPDEGDSADGLICGFALPLCEWETVQLVNSGVSTAIPGAGDSAHALFPGFALSFRNAGSGPRSHSPEACRPSHNKGSKQLFKFFKICLTSKNYVL